MNALDTQPVDDTPPEPVTYRVRWEHSAECDCERCVVKHQRLAQLACVRGAS